jgi:hypothetical protein
MPGGNKSICRQAFDSAGAKFKNQISCVGVVLNCRDGQKSIFGLCKSFFFG